MGMNDTSLDSIRAKVDAGKRLSQKDGIYLLREAPLLDLGQIAMEVRQQRHPDGFVTFVVDSNPNYTNVCNIDCTFCAFYRPPEHDQSYTHSIETMLETIDKSVDKGATTILMQGGVNPELPFEYYLDMVRAFRKRYTDVTPHFWSAVEIEGMATVSGLSLREVLTQLKAAGQTTIPGGGAEILAHRVRRKISHKKGVAHSWVDVHREAHVLGFRSTATMMYGHVEDEEDIVEHLDVIRKLQDKHHGFTAFVPWSFKPGNTPLNKKIPFHAGPNRYLRILAASRLYLDNFEHIQASWFSEGKKTGQVALHWGADDFGGTLFEENVHAATGFINKTTTEEVKTLIREAGFKPAQRTTLYEIIKRFQ